VVGPRGGGGGGGGGGGVEDEEGEGNEVGEEHVSQKACTGLKGISIVVGA
jgi:hypothetical protein